ncbi:hypothetical protein AVEN_88243-1 [Araneus ventricosus]|uniref:Uncharacterized protein n=1 Tax=Araneus ventricosus TaxID=182803 RepID=A0A4Y2IN98_ARAVE|nr:hypothetical protein AVEN_88243-1 [Araneus ventricosus]
MEGHTSGSGLPETFSYTPNTCREKNKLKGSETNKNALHGGEKNKRNVIPRFPKVVQRGGGIRSRSTSTAGWTIAGSNRRSRDSKKIPPPINNLKDMCMLTPSEQLLLAVWIE